jgi:serine/threonine protein kinase
MIVGTAGYMSPEQVQGKPVDPRSDLFSLGIVFYELLTGRRPFSGDSMATTLLRIIGEEAPVPPRSIEPSVPTSIDEIVLRLLAKEPNQRFRSVEQLLTQLSAARRQQLPSATLVTSPAGFDTIVRDGVGAVCVDRNADYKRSVRAPRSVLDAGPPSAPAAMRRLTFLWIAGLLVILLLGTFAFARHRLDAGITVFLIGVLAFWSLYFFHLLKTKPVAPGRARPPETVPPIPPLDRHHGSESWDTATTEFPPYSPTSTDTPAASTITRELLDSFTMISRQQQLSANIPFDVKRRLEEFDAIWNQLTSSALHD